MKKPFASFLSVLLIFVLFVSLIPVSAYAAAINNTIKDGSVNNSIKDDSARGSRGRGHGPCANDLQLASNYDKFDLPKSGSYLSSYSIMYIDAEKGHSVRVHSKTDGKSSSGIDYAYHGGMVIVAAKENGCYCVFFFNQNNDLKAGWVDANCVTTTYPGSTQYIGTEWKSRDLENEGIPSVSWSKDFFVGTKQEYTVLAREADDCVAFTLDYQVIARNGAKTEECLGPRTVYVNDGSGWVSVGTFSLDELVPVHVVVNLDRPMDLRAVATASSCKASDTITFRQSIFDVIVDD